MNFDLANIKSVKADIGKGEITVSFVVDLNPENLTEAECLQDYLASKDEAATSMTVDIYPHQLRLFPPDTKVTLSTSRVPAPVDPNIEPAEVADESDWQPEEVDQPAKTEAPF